MSALASFMSVDVGTFLISAIALINLGRSRESIRDSTSFAFLEPFLVNLCMYAIVGCTSNNPINFKRFMSSWRFLEYGPK